jgi:hypothetical protein
MNGFREGNHVVDKAGRICHTLGMSHTTVIVDTKFGRLALTPTSADHIYATTNPGGGRVDQLLPWTIRGKKHKFITAHLYRHPDGKFRVGGLTPDTSTGLYADTLSSFAKKQAIPALEDAANELGRSQPGVFVTAERDSLTDEIERLKAKSTTLSDELRTVDAEIGRLIEQLDKV